MFMEIRYCQDVGFSNLIYGLNAISVTVQASDLMDIDELIFFFYSLQYLSAFPMLGIRVGRLVANQSYLLIHFYSFT